MNRKKGTVRQVPVLETDPSMGLTEEQARERTLAGLDNREVAPPTKTVGEIILTNVCTYYNLVFTVIAVLILFTGRIQNLAFMGVVVSNTLIGIVQELRSKRVLDKMALLTQRSCRVVREGLEREISVNEAVRDDVVILSGGDQIFADAVTLTGTALVSEALITGEADEIRKDEGDPLTSGSFMVAGTVAARLTAVGEEAYAARLTTEAKRAEARGRSEMMATLTKLVKWIGIALIPFAVLLFLKEHFVLAAPWRDAVVSTAGAIIGMIPEGLYLLTTLALAASVIRLVQRRTLVHELGCIETLARVDVLCVDKTGTITEPVMSVTGIVTPDLQLCSMERAERIIADYAAAFDDGNDTLEAVRRAFPDGRGEGAVTVPFTSAKKFGGALLDGTVYLFGAPDVICERLPSCFEEELSVHTGEGRRVLLLAEYGGDIEDFPLTGEVRPLSLVILENKVRPAAPETFRFFARQGVTVKVISGDRPDAVSAVAARAGIRNADAWVDARTLDTPEKLYSAADTYTVFGRVTPEVKRELVRALRAQGHSVAMTGDGVNDELALKEADCSIAMASGSDACAHAAHIVLLDSDFSAMPAVVAEGRRVINNIERSAALYLSKNVFSFLIALVSLIFMLPYPFSPVQLTLVSTMTIGLPSFILAMEPNENRVRGHFLKNVTLRALPAGLTNALAVIGVILFHTFGVINGGEMSTVATLISCVVGLTMLFDTCMPFTIIRAGLFGVCTLGIVLAVTVLGSPVFGFVLPGAAGFTVLGVFAVAAPALFCAIKLLIGRILRTGK